MTHYIWHIATENDIEALAELEEACKAIDGPASVAARPYNDLMAAADITLLCATNEEGEIVAAGWAQKGKEAHIRGKVHPAHRQCDLGAYLLRQLEELAQNNTFIIRNEALNEASHNLYQQEGYTLDFTENWMQRDLADPLPQTRTDFERQLWSDDNAHLFFQAYADSFKTRPGFKLPEAEEWITDYAEDPDFRADLSKLALIDSKPFGFIAVGVFHIDDLGHEIGWISQIGVVPEMRGRGIASGLIVETLNAFKQEGFPAVGLHVNVNNAEAIGAYQKLGFKRMGQRAKYSKQNNP